LNALHQNPRPDGTADAPSRDTPAMNNKALQVHLVCAGKYHDFDFARLELLKLLSENPAIRTSVASDYANLERLADCDLLITYTCDLMPSAAQTQSLREFVEGGGRWLALHGTNSVLEFTADGRIATPGDHEEFMAILGSQFKAHPPMGSFRVENACPDHPLVRDIPSFDVVDELYMMKLFAPLRPLLHTRFSGNCAPFVDAEWPDQMTPVFYLRDLGDGTVLYLTLGHCRGHFDTSPARPTVPHPERCAWNYPVYYELIRRSIRWGVDSLN